MLKTTTPLLTATPKSSLTFCRLSLTTTADFLLFRFSFWPLTCDTCFGCLTSENAPKGPSSWFMSAGRETSVRKGMGWAWATSSRNSRSCWYRVDRLTRRARKITLMQQKRGSLYTHAHRTGFRSDRNNKHSPKTTEHAGYHQIQDNKLLPFHLLLCESGTKSC